MRKLLLPTSLMVITYLTIHLIAFTVQRNSAELDANAKTLFNSSSLSKRSLKQRDHFNRAKPNKNIFGNAKKKSKIKAVGIKKSPLEFSKLGDQYKVSFKKFIANANNEMSFLYDRTGTSIIIPANGFVSESGDLATGEVEIHYREFNKPSEIFMSGIPMHWQGEEYLESAGMFQIEAYQNGKKLELAPNVEFEITMVSPFKDQNYNLYAFNDKDQFWSYVNNDFSYSVSAIDKTNNDDWRLISNDSLPQYVTQKMAYYIPIKDVVGFNPDYEDALNKNEQMIYRQASVKLVYDESLFPDLQVLGKYEYKVLNHTYTELHDLANRVMNKETSLPTGWKDLKIQYPGRLGVVDLKFINDLDTLVLGAEPIVENLKGKKRFANEYYAYDANYEKSRLGRLSIKKFKMGKKKVDFDKDTALVKQLKTMKMAEKVERKFLANKLMVWNCDRPFPIRPYEPIAVNFMNDRITNISMVYAALPGKNSVFKAEDFIHFPMVNNGEMFLWVLIDENTVAYVSPEMLNGRQWDLKEINDIQMNTMSLDTFLPLLDKEILQSSDKFVEYTL